MTLFAAPALPLHKAGPYVAAAYIVFVVLILAYLAILSVRAARTEREVVRMRREIESPPDEADAGAPPEERIAV